MLLPYDAMQTMSIKHDIEVSIFRKTHVEDIVDKEPCRSAGVKTFTCCPRYCRGGNVYTCDLIPLLLQPERYISCSTAQLQYAAT